MNFTKTIKTEGEMSLCTGKPAFKPLGKIGLGIQINSNPLHRHVTKCGHHKLVSKIEASTFFGLCGPSWATQMQIKGQVDDNNNLKFSVKKDEFAAGLIAGASVGILFELKYSHRHKSCDLLSWHPHCWSTTETAGGAFKVGLDLIKLYSTAIKYILDDDKEGIKQSKEKVDHGGGNVSTPFGTYGMFNLVSDSYMFNQGYMKVHPKYMARLNMIEYIAKSFPAFYAFYESMQKIHIELKAGPAFGIAIPLKLEIDNIQIGDAHYSDIKYSHTKKSMIANSSNDIHPNKDDKFSVTFKETPSVDLVAGVYFELSVFFIWHIEAQANAYLLEEIGVDFKIGEYKYTIDEDKYDEDIYTQKCSEDIEVIFV
jgi:hypothetical protein